MYGNTWWLVGDIIQILGENYLRFTVEYPHGVHNWVLIMSKMVRILFTPKNPDHWRDIAGYATLQLTMLEEIQNETSSSSAR
jgi:hypothetical protein